MKFIITSDEHAPITISAVASIKEAFPDAEIEFAARRPPVIGIVGHVGSGLLAADLDIDGVVIDYVDPFRELLRYEFKKPRISMYERPKKPNLYPGYWNDIGKNARKKW